MSDYADILKTSWDEIPEPQTLPIGSYLLKGRNATYQKPAAEDKKPVVLFVSQPKEAMDDVDTRDLVALGENYDITENRIFTRVYIESKGDWDKVRKILNKHGIETVGKQLEDSLKAFPGHEAIGYLDVSTFTDKATGEIRKQNVVKEWAPVEG